MSWGSGESSTGLPWLRNCEEPCERFCLCALRTDFRVKPSTFSAAEMAADMAGRRGGSPRAYIVPEGEAGGQKRKWLKKKTKPTKKHHQKRSPGFSHTPHRRGRSGASSAGRWGGSRVAPQFLLPSPFPPRAEPAGERKGGGGGGKGNQTNKPKDNFARRGGGGRAPNFPSRGPALLLRAGAARPTAGRARRRR